MFRIPDGFKDLLPEEAEVFYFIQQKIYNSLKTFGYNPVIPSSIEFIKTYILSSEPEEQIFNFIDNYENKTACFRFDFTPQIARIISSNKDLIEILPARICYFGSVLRNASNLSGLSREIYHAGVELIGISDIKAEMEIISVIYEIEQNLNMSKGIKLFLNDNEILKKLLKKTGLINHTELKEAFIYRDITMIENIVNKFNLNKKIRNIIIELPLLCGNHKILTKIDCDIISENLKNLKIISDFALKVLNKEIFFDLGEVRGFEYHSGIVFDGYAEDIEGNMQEIITGGRYDKLLENFGMKKMSATGFAIDIHKLSKCIKIKSPINCAIIFDDLLLEGGFKIAEILRKKGIMVSNLFKINKKIPKNKFDYILFLNDNNKLAIENSEGKTIKKFSFKKIFDLEKLLNEFVDSIHKE